MAEASRSSSERGSWAASSSDELELLRVLDHVQRRGLEAGFRLELDQALVLQHQQHAAAVGRVVRDAEARAFLQVLQALDLLRVDADREVDGVADRR